jgi:pimeloyl-ACP methyl ester carboxylesterase
VTLPEFRNRSGELLDTAFHPGNREGTLVLLGHGVTGNKDRPLLVAVAEGLAARGWPCLRISFAGNGDSKGRFEDCTVSKECDDLRSILDALPANLKIAYAGHSMGGGVGTRVAASDPRISVLVSLAGMIRLADFHQAEFGDVTPDAGLMWDEPDCPLSGTFADDMTNLGDLFAEAAAVKVPWLLIHGTADDVVLPKDSRDGYAAAGEPKRLVEIDGAGHSFDDATYPQVIASMNDWLAKHLA